MSKVKESQDPGTDGPAPSAWKRARQGSEGRAPNNLIFEDLKTWIKGSAPPHCRKLVLRQAHRKEEVMAGSWDLEIPALYIIPRFLNKYNLKVLGDI